MARLNYLTEIGIAERAGPLSWNVRSDFRNHTSSISTHDAKRCWPSSFLSDPRLQYRVLTPDTTKEIVVCMVAHVLDEASDRPHALIRRAWGTRLWTPGKSWPHDGTSRIAGHFGPQLTALIAYRTVVWGSRFSLGSTQKAWEEVSQAAPSGPECR